jgi:hypothetical protein
MSLIEWRQHDPEDEALMAQLFQRLRSICQSEAWSYRDPPHTNAQLIFRPWDKSAPAVHANPTVLTHRPGPQEQKITLLVLAIRGFIPQPMINRHLQDLTAACVRLGVNFTVAGPANVPPFFGADA